ncbi:MAG: glycosyltransferase family 2 protein [Candidatus Omnitrophica bacterium]|nr:glycosyltransferase family 2 protein [Candidatus Omnitrophota bacterium]
MRDPIVSVIIVNWNGERYLERCLTSVKKQTYQEIELIVVDNGSSDDSVEFIKRNYPEIQIIKNKRNLGFAEGNNIGIKASRGKYIATLNNDTIAAPDWIESLVNVAEKRKDIAMFASKILSHNYWNLMESAGMLIYPDGIARCRGYLKVDRGQYDKVEEILLPSACAALYRKDAVFAAGLFDKDYFAYCEDTDLGLRIRMLGLGCLYVPDARVYHHYSGTSKDISLFKVYLIERNRLWMIIKTFPLSQLILSPVYTLIRYLFYIYGAILRIEPASEFCRKESIIKIPFILLWIYTFTLLNLPKIIKKRFQVKRNKKIKDGDIINWFRRYRIGVRELTLYTEISS